MILKIAGPAVVVTLIAFAFAHNSTHIAGVAKANKLNPEETAAFSACNLQTTRVSITFRSGRNDSFSSNIPDSVCVCQAREMARVFKPGEYGDHRRVVDYLTKKTGTQELDAARIRPGEGSATSQFGRLLGSFNACTDQYGAEQFAQSEALKQQRGKPRS